jgi:transcriptional regulator with XRE-family HTH domain
MRMPDSVGPDSVGPGSGAPASGGPDPREPAQDGPEPRGAQREIWAAQRTALGAFIREHRKQANLSLRQLAERTRLSNPYLSQIERGLHQPSVRVLRAISDALNMSAETLLTQAGLIDALAAGADAEAAEAADAGGQPEVPETERAIARDKRLTEDQKSALLAVYRSMLKQAG